MMYLFVEKNKKKLKKTTARHRQVTRAESGWAAGP
jgi:hypothetical protein